MVLHTEKKALRVLGVAESFRESQRSSALAGIVMRADLVIDGVALERLTVAGSDGTEAVLRLYEKLGRNDINSLMISGSVLSLYNILDLEAIYRGTGTGVLAVSFRPSSSDLRANIRRRFPAEVAEQKVELLDRLGESSKIRLKTGYNVHARFEGFSQSASERLLNRFTLQGAIPEPIRVARLFAKSIANVLPS